MIIETDDGGTFNTHRQEYRPPRQRFYAGRRNNKWVVIDRNTGNAITQPLPSRKEATRFASKFVGVAK